MQKITTQHQRENLKTKNQQKKQNGLDGKND